MSDAEKKPEPAEPGAMGPPPSEPDLDEAEGDLDEEPPREEGAPSVLDDVDVRDLLRSALAPPPGRRAAGHPPRRAAQASQALARASSTATGGARRARRARPTCSPASSCWR